MSDVTGARQRINALLDESSFVEIGGLVTARATDFNMKPAEAVSDGVITGYGVIDGKPVYVYSQDSSVLGGTIGEMHARKIVRLYDLALKTGAPVVGILDCAGVRLQEGVDAMQALGSIYAKMSEASGVIPQVTVVCGSCGGGEAVLTQLSDFTFMTDRAKLFVNSPDAIKGNTQAKMDSSAAAYQTEESGNACFAGTEPEALSACRQLLSYLPSNSEDGMDVAECADDLNRAVAGVESYADEPAEIFKQIADDGLFLELGASYGKAEMTGFLRLDGVTVGGVAATKKLGAPGVEKAAHFVSLCDAYGIPVLALVNVGEYCNCEHNEKHIAKAMSRLITAYASATVPKVTVVTGKALGSAGLVFSKACGADLCFAWEGAQIGAMEPDLAAKVLCSGQGAEAINKCKDEYAALQDSALGAARRGFVDGVIAPADTRQQVIAAFELLFQGSGYPIERKHASI